jgi:TadE-like protein
MSYRFTQAKSLERGAALLELALVLPLLLLMAVGVVNFGTALREKQIIIEAARYGARRAAAEGKPCDSSGTFERCDQVLANIPSTLEVRGLGMYYACQSLDEGRLTPNDWEVNSDIDTTGIMPAVSIHIQRAVPVSLFVSTLMGPTFPAISGTFICREDCS